MDTRLENLLKQADESAAIWRPGSYIDRKNDGENEIDPSLRGARRVLLFHIAAILDANDCFLEAIEENEMEYPSYYKLLYRAVVHETIELDSNMNDISESFPPIMTVLDKSMMTHNSSVRRREPTEALQCWEKLNKNTEAIISSRPFNMTTRALVSSQASSAPVKRFFSNLKKVENDRAQFMLCRALVMTGLRRMFVMNEPKNLSLPQVGAQYLEAAHFLRLLLCNARKTQKNSREQHSF